MQTKHLQSLLRREISIVPTMYQNDSNDAENIQLNLMENPYDLPSSLKKKWLHMLSSIELNRYPDPSNAELRIRIIEHLKLSDKQDVIFSNGLMQMIQTLALAFAKPNQVVMAPGPSFFLFKRYTLQAFMNYIELPLTPKFDIDLNKTLDLIQINQPRLIFIDYPNNPTGALFSRDAILEIIRNTPGFVVIDEAYAPYSDSSFLGDIANHENVILIRSFSKFGFAAIRLGYAIANHELVAYLKKVIPPFAINTLTQKTAEFVLDHYSDFIDNLRVIKKDKNHLFSLLQSIPGVTPYPSFGNFILFKVDPVIATKLHELLRDERILINRLHGIHPLCEGCLRCAIGKSQDNEILINKLQQLTPQLLQEKLHV